MIRQHPTLPVLVRDDGLVSITSTTKNQFKTWTTQSPFKRGWLKPQGYRAVEIKHKPYYIHELVAETFIGPRPEGMVIDHINRDKEDNRPLNLRYCSQLENNHNSDKYEYEHSERLPVYMDDAVKKYKRKLTGQRYYRRKIEAGFKQKDIQTENGISRRWVKEN